MFNRELKVQFVKAPKQKSDPDADGRKFHYDQEQIYNLVQENVKRAAIFVAVGYAGKRVLDTVSEIALIAARSNFK